MVSTALLIFGSEFSRKALHALRLCVKKTSWTVFNYFATLHQTQNTTKERTQWQPKKEARSPEARAKVVAKRQRRARQNPSPEAAQRSRPRRQPRSLQRRAERKQQQRRAVQRRRQQNGPARAAQV